MKKEYQSPDFDLVRFQFEKLLGDDPGEGGHAIGQIVHSDAQGFGEGEGEL